MAAYTAARQKVPRGVDAALVVVAVGNDDNFAIAMVINLGLHTTGVRR